MLLATLHHHLRLPILNCRGSLEPLGEVFLHSPQTSRSLYNTEISTQQQQTTYPKSVSYGLESESLVDILISTPGRLMDIMHLTEGFTLRHLHFLVIDEADRLLMQSYQGWLPKVRLKHLKKPNSNQLHQSR